MIDDNNLSSALDAIERAEAALLAWGILDRGLERHEIEDLVASVVDPMVVAPTEVVRELVDRKVVFGVPQSSPPSYRSRMAEGVRLFAHLRQQFPGRQWTSSPRLVADHRFLVRPRSFPRRTISVDELEAQLAAVGLTSVQREALHALVGESPTDDARRVARFQAEATEGILRSLGQGRDEAHIVTAGTGSGKTLAFYLPTLLHLVADGQRGNGVRVLAVYPRKELLKDQFMATLRETRRLRRVRPDLPKVRLGAYFGPTPLGGRGRLPDYLEWERRASPAGDVCPYLTCPGATAEGCGGDLVWTDADRNASRERLTCIRCGEMIDQDEIVLSRQAMSKSAPDIVFATTEMLNLALHNGWARKVFCGERAVRPQMVLIDEAHTYFGATGAQNAYVLRRWRHVVGRPVTWVGLSATLRDAEQFFSALTGVPAHAVREITPAPEDMERRGHEYQLLLRGDPASQAALLSTSIQSLMLLARLLDPLEDHVSDGTYGSKVFAFCDKLDLTNRLHQQLLDAEGRTKRGRQVRASLAELRSARARPDVDDWAERDRDGQSWWAIDRLRGDAGPPVVGRTSSQDGGVLARAEVVVATAALEVGYDDPDVGAVLQHKAPRDLAQFVQRRGRAGRSRDMRPWTVAVLSDFGRDRIAYQSYEQLFDPLLPPRSLPLGNRSVRRMQATFALMDWASIKLFQANPQRRTAVGSALAGPMEKEHDRAFQRDLVALLTTVLDDPAVRSDAVSHIRQSLGLTPAELDIVLWDGPRSVLLEAVPTAVRRLQSGWASVVDGHVSAGSDTIRGRHPLPEMLPANLFSDLALPEVAVVSPEGYDRAADAEEPAFLALREMAPGNVTLRYAVRDTRGLWIDPGTDDGLLDIEGSMLEGAWPLAEVDGASGQPIEVLRPVEVRPDVAGQSIGTTSSGRLDWRFRATPEMDGLVAPLPDASPWATVVESTEFYVQARRGGVRVLRYAESGSAVVSRRPGGRNRVRYRLARGDVPVAVGVELDVDAMCITISPPAGLDAVVLAGDAVRLRKMRSDRLAADAAERLAPLGVDHFLSRWLSELTIAAIAHEECLGEGVAPRQWSAPDWHERLVSAFDRAFQSPTLDVDEPSDAALRDQIVASLSAPGITDALADAHEAASADPGLSWTPWLRRRFSVTVAAAVHSGVQALLPEFDAETDLVVDLVDLPDGEVELWLSETTTGGGGIVESLHAAYGEDPRRFWSLAASALEPSDIEDASAGLHQVATLLVGPLTAEVSAHRSAGSVDETLSSWRNLLGAVAKRGITPTHALSVAMATRLVRSGSSAEGDSAVLLALSRWSEWEERVGLALDERTVCSLLATQDDVLDALRRAVPDAPRASLEGWAANVLLGVLWASPETVRPASLVAPMSFSDDVPPSERTLVLEALDDAAPEIPVDRDGWRALADAALGRQGKCRLVAPAGSAASLRDALLGLASHPVEVGALHLHPRVVGVRRRAATSTADVVLDEAPQ